MAGQTGLESAAIVSAIVVAGGWASLVAWCRLEPSPRRTDASARPTPDDLTLNTVNQGAELYLRVTVGHSERVHLAGTVPLESDAGRPAIRGHLEPTSELTGSLADYACWTARTLCGMPWEAMASDDDELDAVAASVARGEGGDTHDCPVCAVAVIDDAWDPSARRR
jgi:hypothetical protein